MTTLRVMSRPSTEMAQQLVGWLAGLHNGVCEPGPTDAEIERAQEVFGLTFSPLWRSVLRLVHPIAKPGTSRPDWPSFPDWRLRHEAATRQLIEAPVEGLLFDVEHNGFWWNAWGSQPATVIDRLKIARRELAEVPRLTPLWGHRYIAETGDSPVFSIVQADLAVPALTLGGLLDGQDLDRIPVASFPIGRVPFWSELHAYSVLGHDENSPFAKLATGGL